MSAEPTIDYPLLDAAAAASRIGVSVDALHAAVERGELPAMRFSRQRRMTRFVASWCDEYKAALEAACEREGLAPLVSPPPLRRVTVPRVDATGKPVPDHVYLVEATTSPFCKIGIASNPHRRLHEIQTSCPFSVRLVGVWLVGALHARSIEQSALKAFRAMRAEGEWLRLRRGTALRQIAEVIDELARARCGAEWTGGRL